MHLIRLPLNLTSPKVRNDLVDINSMHKRVQSLIAPQRSQADLLWAVEGDTLFLQTNGEPVFPERLPAKYATAPAHIQSVTPPLEGETVTFTAWLNPTKMEGATRRRLFLDSPEDRLAWVHRRFAGPLSDISVREVEQARLRGEKAGKSIVVVAVRFEISGTVSDADAFAELLRNGVGRGKAYGCGLLRLR